jgi:anti-sigma regulatory factor (Ser/Thr protein kinase)
MIEWLKSIFGRMFGGGIEPQEWHFQIKGERKEIGALNDALERAAASGGVPEDALRAVQVALDELLTNCVSYAPISAANPAKVDVTLDRKSVMAVISYQDNEFNPLARETPDLDASISDRQIGGLGIHLVKEMMDDFTHRYEDGRNILTIIKKH